MKYHIGRVRKQNKIKRSAIGFLKTKEGIASAPVGFGGCHVE